jgi:uncharacterized membrane protein
MRKARCVATKRERGECIREMLRLAGDVTYLVARALVDAALQLLGVAVGLFYWSVRTYGWGRVLSFLVALWFAVALRGGVSQWSASRAGLVTLVASTLCLWGAMLFGSALARQMWRRWMESLESGVPRLSGGRSFRFGLAMEQGRRKGRRIPSPSMDPTVCGLACSIGMSSPGPGSASSPEGEVQGPTG